MKKQIAFFAFSSENLFWFKNHIRKNYPEIYNEYEFKFISSPEKTRGYIFDGYYIYNQPHSNLNEAFKYLKHRNIQEYYFNTIRK